MGSTPMIDTLIVQLEPWEISSIFKRLILSSRRTPNLWRTNWRIWGRDEIGVCSRVGTNSTKVYSDFYPLNSNVRRRQRSQSVAQSHSHIKRAALRSHEWIDRVAKGSWVDADLNEQDEKREKLFGRAVSREGHSRWIVWPNYLGSVKNTNEGKSGRM